MSASPALAAALLHTLWVDGLVALAAAMALGLMNRASAAARHRAGMGFLWLMAAAPLGVFFLLWSQGVPANGVHGARVMMESSGWAFRPPVWVGGAWGLGVSLMLARMAGGWWVVKDLLREESGSLPEVWLRKVEAMAAALRISRPVEVRLSATLGLPLSARAWRPVVWLPLSTLTQLAPVQLEALLAHELAHVARLDWIWNGMQRLIEALLFFHPGVWWLSRRIRQEREHACDDAAVALCGDAIALAEALATLEGLRTSTRVLALTANGGSLMERIRRLLSPAPPPKFRWGLSATLLALLGTGALMAARDRPSAQTPKPGQAPAAPRPGDLDLPPGASTYVVDNDSNGIRRVYRKSKDRQGRISESYRENGQDRPITGDVRRWLAEEKRKAAEEAAREEAEDAEAERQGRAAAVEGLKAELEGLKIQLEVLKTHSRDLSSAEKQTLEAGLASLGTQIHALSPKALSMGEDAFEREMDALEADMDRIQEQFDAAEPMEEDEDAFSAPTPPPPAPSRPPLPPRPVKAHPAPPPPPPAPPAPPAPPKPKTPLHPL